MRPALKLTCISLLILAAVTPALAKSPPHTLALSTNEFLLDGKPFQMRSGEIHPNRIPKEYWRHRIQMAKAMSLNTIADIFWNHHEVTEGRFDFKTGNRDLPEFFRIAQDVAFHPPRSIRLR